MLAEYFNVIKAYSYAALGTLIVQGVVLNNGYYRAMAIAWMFSVLVMIGIRYVWRMIHVAERIFLSSPTMNGMELNYIQEAFDENWIAPLGENVNGFEKAICDHTGANYAVAMTTGTAAIHMALKHLGVKEGDIVFCSSLTFAASCNPIIYQNATPVFIDSEEETWNMSPRALEKAFEQYKPKAVIVVHLYGTPAKMDEIKAICDYYGVPIVEDAAESLGATYKGKQTGTLGHFGIFSFNGNKIITTSGGGMLICQTQEEKERITKWITQSRDIARHYQHSELGFNYRMSNILAGIGRGQMKSLEQRVQTKTAIYNYYKKAFSDIPDISMNPVSEHDQSNHWLSCMLISKESKVSPEDIMMKLEQKNIECRPVWKPMQLQPFFEKYDFINHNESGISVSEDIFNRGLCLPSDVKLKDKDLKRIVDIVRSCF
ncbi:MAG: aminotransferase DegT [Bacillales bacterium]|nr:aminotransferase DegT [Bacillales bacterium]